MLDSNDEFIYTIIVLHRTLSRITIAMMKMVVIHMVIFQFDFPGKYHGFLLSNTPQKIMNQNPRKLPYEN